MFVYKKALGSGALRPVKMWAPGPGLGVGERETQEGAENEKGGKEGERRPEGGRDEGGAPKPDTGRRAGRWGGPGRPFCGLEAVQQTQHRGSSRGGLHPGRPGLWGHGVSCGVSSVWSVCPALTLSFMVTATVLCHLLFLFFFNFTSPFNVTTSADLKAGDLPWSPGVPLKFDRPVKPSHDGGREEGWVARTRQEGTRRRPEATLDGLCLQSGGQLSPRPALLVPPEPDHRGPPAAKPAWRESRHLTANIQGGGHAASTSWSPPHDGDGRRGRGRGRPGHRVSPQLSPFRPHTVSGCF